MDGRSAWLWVCFLRREGNKGESADSSRGVGRCAGHWQQAIKEIIWYYLTGLANFCPVYAGQLCLECLDIPQHLEVDIVGVIQGLAA